MGLLESHMAHQSEEKQQAQRMKAVKEDAVKKSKACDDLLMALNVWMTTLLQRSQRYPDFCNDLRGGSDLCLLLNALAPNTVPAHQIKMSYGISAIRHNHNLFQQGCNKFGVPQHDIIKRRVLEVARSKKRPSAELRTQLIVNLYSLSAAAGRYNKHVKNAH